MNRGIKEALTAVGAAAIFGGTFWALVALVPAPWSFVLVGAIIIGGSIWFGRS